MCGLEITPKPRGGALAALSRPHGSDGFGLQADLVFHSLDSPAGTTATHMRLTPSGGTTPVAGHLDDYVVVIHETGDLLREVGECGHFCEFPVHSAGNGCGQAEDDVALGRSVSLEVSSDGIIGRRVSLYSNAHSANRHLVAEGIIGFNS